VPLGRDSGHGHSDMAVEDSPNDGVTECLYPRTVPQTPILRKRYTALLQECAFLCA